MIIFLNLIFKFKLILLLINWKDNKCFIELKDWQNVVRNEING